MADEGDHDDEMMEDCPVEKDNNKREKKIEPGIIYLSTIPPTMSVKKIRDVFGYYGEVGRIFLQPKDKKFNKGYRVFTEGWVEFKNKKIGKKVASCLNNTQVGGKRRDKHYDTLWNIKYLHRFRWTHLNERLAYEKAVHQQRMRAEVAQVKRETNYFAKSVEKGKKLNRVKSKAEKAGREWIEKHVTEPRQNLTEEEINSENDKHHHKGTSLLNSIFSAKQS